MKLWKFPGFFSHPTSILQFDGVIHVWGISDIVTVEDPLDDLVPDFWIDFFPHLGDDELESIPIIVEDFFRWTLPCCNLLLVFFGERPSILDISLLSKSFLVSLPATAVKIILKNLS